MINRGLNTAEVTISGVDDGGHPSSGSVKASIPSGASRMFSAAQLEAGAPGLEGALGVGQGKWQLNVESDQQLMDVMSLLETPTGHLSNLSSVRSISWRGIAPPDPPDPDPGDVPTPEMIELPSGRFDMGCLSDDEDCGHSELPVHEVIIERAFALSKYEVTMGEWFACVDGGGCPPGRISREFDVRKPVYNVNWNDARAYVRWLSRELGQTYRLPSEAEWEYAARAGSTTKFTWGDEVGVDRANCDGCWSEWNFDRARVGTFAANAWGLHDMHGNVSEVVEDCWNENYEGAPADGSAWTSGDCTRRVIRGGNYALKPRAIRSAHRDWVFIDDDTRHANHGFRGGWHVLLNDRCDVGHFRVFIEVPFHLLVSDAG